MFIGHFAFGFAAKKFAPRQNGAVLILAPLFLDVVFPFLILAGIEKAHIEPGHTRVMPVSLDSMPWSHSLLMSVVWSVLFGATVMAFTKDRRGALICAALVFSHFVCDWVTHTPDLQLVPWSETRVGLGLWNSIPGTVGTELALMLAGCYLYLTSTRAKDRVGSIVPVAFMVVLTIIYFGNVFGPPPPSVNAFAIAIVAALLILPLVFWYDRHREARGTVANA